MRSSKTGLSAVFILSLLFGTVWPGYGPAANEAHAASGTIWYVKTDGSDDNGGTSWEDAFATLDKALEMAEEGDEIRIAQGTYYPTKNGDGTDPRTVHFRMKKGVAIYGGFRGTGPNPDERDIENYRTIRAVIWTKTIT